MLTVLPVVPKELTLSLCASLFDQHRIEERSAADTRADSNIILIPELNQLNHRWTGLTLKLKVGKKGYIILPKSIRESVGIEEGDTVTVEVGEGITLLPTKKPDTTRLRRALHEHAERLKTLKEATSPAPDELASISLEEELEE